MIELTLKDSAIRLAICERDKRIIINRPDSVIVLCLLCGGAKSVVMRVQASQTDIPPLRQCRCDVPLEYVPHVDTVEKMLTSDGEVERMYIRLKGEM